MAHKSFDKIINFVDPLMEIVVIQVSETTNDFENTPKEKERGDIVSIITVPRPMSPVTPYGKEISNTGVTRYDNINTSLEPSIFSKQYYREVGEFDSEDIYVNPNDQITKYADEIPESYKCRGFIPLYNPNARQRSEIYETIMGYKLKGLGTVSQARVFRLSKDGQIACNGYNFFDLWRNWKYVMPHDNIQYYPLDEPTVHLDESGWLTRENISGNEKISEIVFPPSRIKELKYIRAEEINRIYNQDSVVIENYNKIYKSLRRQLTEEEQSNYNCVFCGRVPVFAIVCQSYNRKPGKHNFCFPCIFQYIKDKEKSYCAAIEAYYCPFRFSHACTNWVTYSDNARPVGFHHVTIVVQLTICPFCRFLATPLRMSTHECKREFPVELRPFEFSKNEDRMKKYKSEIISYKLANKTLLQKIETAELNAKFHLQKTHKEDIDNLERQLLTSKRKFNQIESDFKKQSSIIKKLIDENEKLKLGKITNPICINIDEDSDNEKHQQNKRQKYDSMLPNNINDFDSKTPQKPEVEFILNYPNPNLSTKCKYLRRRGRAHGSLLLRSDICYKKSIEDLK